MHLKLHQCPEQLLVLLRCADGDAQAAFTESHPGAVAHDDAASCQEVINAAGFPDLHQQEISVGGVDALYEVQAAQVLRQQGALPQEAMHPLPLLSGVAGAFPCFALPAVVPIGVRMLAEGDRVHLIMGLMVVIFGAAMFASAFQVRRVFRDAEDLRQRLTSTIEAGHALERMVRRDTLTGIANRRLFEEKLAEEWRRARRDRESLSVITADIDHFKQFNDRYGHPAGDHCLTVVAQAMAQSLARPGDVVARIGGEEFAFLLPQTSLEGAIAVAEHIRQKIVDLNLQHDASPVSQWVTVSFGVASSDQRSITSPADLLRASDVALYDAKRGGRNRTAAFRA